MSVDQPDRVSRPAAGTSMKNRWKLNRAGILNVYQYGDETIDLAGGRLLLRGVNGSGKSTAMNMLLPFLIKRTCVASMQPANRPACCVPGCCRAARSRTRLAISGSSSNALTRGPAR